MLNFFDLHSHLHDKAFDSDRDLVLKEMKQKGVGTITIGTGLIESRKAVELSEKSENVFSTVGLHPADNPLEEFDRKEFEKLAKTKKVVAIGECGLDYHYIETFFEKDKKEKEISWDKDGEKERQKKIFQEQITLAIEIDKPLMLHGRPSKGTMDAYEDILDILEKEKKRSRGKLRGNIHFFVGDIEIAARFIDLEFSISFSGVITFTKDYDDVVRFVPLTMIHAETDSPYATPTPFRGKRNDPTLVQEIVAKIAVLRHEPMSEVRLQLLKNAQIMFGV